VGWRGGEAGLVVAAGGLEFVIATHFEYLRQLALDSDFCTWIEVMWTRSLLVPEVDGNNLMYSERTVDFEQTGLLLTHHRYKQHS